MNRRLYLNNPNVHDIEEVTYFNNEPFSGTLYDTYEDGIVSLEIKLKDGLKQGITTQYYESGSIKLETDYKDDLEDGIEKVYHESGFVVEISEYHRGNLVSKDSILSLIKKPLTLFLLTNLFSSFDYFKLKKDRTKLLLEFIEEDFYPNSKSSTKDLTEYQMDSKPIFSGLRSSIIPFEWSDEGDFDELVESPIEIPGIFGFSDNTSSKSVYVITNVPNVQISGSWDYRTTREFDDIDKLISYIEQNYQMINYNDLSNEEQKRVTYINRGENVE